MGRFRAASGLTSGFFFFFGDADADDEDEDDADDADAAGLFFTIFFLLEELLEEAWASSLRLL